MKDVKKSYIRVKLAGVFSASLLIGLAWIILDVSALVQQVFFVSILVLGLYTWTIKCENCGTMAFQMHNKERNGFRLKYFGHAPKCPICGIDRY